MMNLYILIFSILTVVTSLATSQNATTGANKSKRTVMELQNPGEVKPVGIIYQVDNPPHSPTYQTNEASYNHANLQNFYTNSNKFFPQASTPVKTVKAVFEDTPKVAAQHFVYEYEQTPTNAVSNVQVKQLFQPINDYNEEVVKASQTQKVSVPAQGPFVTQSETVVNPVQHSTLVNHAQNFAHVYHPLYNVQPTHVQHQPIIPNKYLYVNGKIVYQPGQQQPTQPTAQPLAPRTSFQNVQTHLPHNIPRPVNNFNLGQHQTHNAYQQNRQGQRLPLINHLNRSPPLQKMIPPAIPFTRFHPPPISQMQQITQPIPTHPRDPPEVEEQNQEEEEDKEDIREEEEVNEEEEEDDEGEKANLEDEAEEEDDDDGKRRYKPEKIHNLFGKYSFDADEDDDDDRPRYRDHDNLEEEEEAEKDDRDTNRGSSKRVHSKIKRPSKKNKNPDKYDKKDSYSYSEGYSSSSKYESPGKSKKGKGKPKHHYKKVKYSTNSKSKPKIEVIEGKHSENIPITHKQKFIKEKFYVTRSYDK